MKNLMAVIGTLFVTYVVCKLYGTAVHGFYAVQYDEKLEEYKAQHPYVRTTPPPAPAAQ
jgi:hypothetical protein